MMYLFSQNSTEVYLNDGSTGEEKANFLMKSFETYCRLRIHLYAQVRAMKPKYNLSNVSSVLFVNWFVFLKTLFPCDENHRPN